MANCWQPVQTLSRGAIAVIGLTLATVLGSCDTTTTDQYQASATVKYAWLVPYQSNEGGAGERPPRIEEFESTYLVNQNGQKPDGAVTGPDDKGLWWPELPPRPTLDEMEARQRPRETIGTPKLNKSAEYSITYRLPGQPNRTVPTRYEVYRQVVRAYENRTPLEFTLGAGDTMVIKAEPK